MNVSFGIRRKLSDEQLGTLKLTDLSQEDVRVFRDVLERNGCTTFRAWRGSIEAHIEVVEARPE